MNRPSSFETIYALVFAVCVVAALVLLTSCDSSPVMSSGADAVAKR